ncbi:hypothetical protein DFH08DRAFT_805760 [Mycena albidolilacea]|uniref:Uncharacterized protein n=1 Tax=Mycena albidolilacea TaxID=1033008 RepID=A0AAD7A9G5_9AGAR|nr:hypothetical protein DFH08DRAFT_805760 [Mycena albidolilacea]
MPLLDHEPPRCFFIHIFIFIALTFTNIWNGNTETGNRPRLTGRMSAHLPDLCTHKQCTSVYLTSWFYGSIKNKEVLPLDAEVAQELSLAWKLAHNLDAHVSQAYTFVSVEPSSPFEAQVLSTYLEAADLALVTMAVSMHRYVTWAYSDDKKMPQDEKTLPPGLTPSMFKTQHKDLLRYEKHSCFTSLETRYYDRAVSGYPPAILIQSFGSDLSNYSRRDLYSGLCPSTPQMCSALFC